MKKSRLETLLILFCLKLPPAGLDEKKAAGFEICCLLVFNDGALKKLEQACTNLKKVCMALLRNRTGVY